MELIGSMRPARPELKVEASAEMRESAEKNFKYFFEMGEPFVFAAFNDEIIIKSDAEEAARSKRFKTPELAVTYARLLKEAAKAALSNGEAEKIEINKFISLGKVWPKVKSV